MAERDEAVGEEAGEYPVGAAGADLGSDEEGLYLRAEDGSVVRAAARNLSGARRGRDLLRRAVGDLRSDGGGAEVVDATAGLGADAFHLASLGVRTTMVERVPQVAALLAYTLARARSGQWGPEAEAAAGRLRLVEDDARAYLEGRRRAGEPPAVVLIDPMYPRSGKAALPAKGMALFRELVGEDEDADELLATALESATRRVVVKRPRRAPYLGGVRPSGSLEGSTTRYDLYAPRPPRG